MSQTALISILIPFKNTAAFLPECFDSILNQTYTHWEIIAVDDGSEDESWSLVQSYATKHSNIKLRSNHGKGIIPALQTAYKASCGDLITRMDSDDIMTANKLNVLATSLLRKGAGHVAIGKVRYFSKSGISDGYARYEKWLNGLTQNGTNYTEIYKECVIPSPCWMVYKTDLDRCNAFDLDRYPEDYDLAFRFYEMGLQCIPCSEILHLWRDYAHRTSRTSVHYAQNYFLDIKLYYFLKLDRDAERPLVLWGAGGKGKSIAKKLIESQIHFYWLCDNPNKIGKKIYGIEMLHFNVLSQLKKPQSIITVANYDAQKHIRNHLHGLGYTATTDSFFFC
ncbi:glycosyltransferase [Arenibacter sp. GZD96]|uniref:glycosyltransferase n=1 Tax=Aurantibrevibacter litoralis TaxID=3106030 RepID=UPI002AFE9B96|nr:glycosyltransferase [Arenibacter sp. GZD-96]MEA1787485.1 glycosyltransferase [Arenibacter sp. GZD-96]